MKSLQEIVKLREGLRIGINDQPDEYNFEDFINKKLFTLSFSVRHDGEKLITLNWISIDDYQEADNNTNIKGKINAFNQNAYASRALSNTSIEYINPGNEFICSYHQDKIFSSVVNIYLFFNPKLNADIISNLLNELLKTKSSDVIEYSIGDIFDKIGIYGSDFEQYIGKTYDIKARMAFKKAGIKDIISNLSIVKESLRIGINDKPEFSFDEINSIYLLFFDNHYKECSIRTFSVNKIEDNDGIYYIDTTRIPSDDQLDQYNHTFTAGYDEQNQIFYSISNSVLSVIVPNNTEAGELLLKNVKTFKGGTQYTINDILETLNINFTKSNKFDLNEKIYKYVKYVDAGF